MGSYPWAPMGTYGYPWVPTGTHAYMHALSLMIGLSHLKSRELNPEIGDNITNVVPRWEHAISMLDRDLGNSDLRARSFPATRPTFRKESQAPTAHSASNHL
jgi:hypothetical protein